MSKLNISKEGIEKAMRSRNNVLNAMGFESEHIAEVEEVKEIVDPAKVVDTTCKYGVVVVTDRDWETHCI